MAAADIITRGSSSASELVGHILNAMEPEEEGFSLRPGQLADHPKGPFEHPPQRVHEILILISQVRAEPGSLFAEKDHQIGRPPASPSGCLSEAMARLAGEGLSRLNGSCHIHRPIVPL